jgi:hypothetical protein
MHMCTCAPNAERIPLYTVNLPFSFNNLVRRYAPSLDPVVYGVPMNPEEFGGFADGHVLLRRLVGLCALCAVLSHTPMLYPSVATRKSLEAILASLTKAYLALHMGFAYPLCISMYQDCNVRTVVKVLPSTGDSLRAS